MFAHCQGQQPTNQIAMIPSNSPKPVSTPPPTLLHSTGSPVCLSMGWPTMVNHAPSRSAYDAAMDTTLPLFALLLMVGAGLMAPEPARTFTTSAVRTTSMLGAMSRTNHTVAPAQAPQPKRPVVGP